MKVTGGGGGGGGGARGYVVGGVGGVCGRGFMGCGGRSSGDNVYSSSP